MMNPHGRRRSFRTFPRDLVQQGGRIFAFVSTGLVLGVLLAGCGSVGSGRPPDILLVTLDTTRADYLGCYGREGAETSTLDRLAAEGTLYEQCVTPVPITLPAHASILTGLNPYAHAVRDNGTHALGPGPDTLAELLSARGYDTAAFVSAYVLDSQYGLDRGFDHYNDTVGASAATLTIEERIAGETASAAIKWLGQEHDRPWFLWVHFFDPHLKYSAPGEWGARFAENPYAGEIAYMDHELGRLLEAVDLDSTFVVAVGDHGESLGDHGAETHGFFVYDSTLRVPLIVREPGAGRPGVRVNAQVSIVDVFPTVLEAGGAPVPDGIDGLELSRAVREEDRFVYFECVFPFAFGWSPLIGLRSSDWKYIHAPRPELYRISGDPGETENVIDRHPDIAEDLADQLAVLDPLENLGEEASASGITPEAREALGALGYLGGILPEKTVDYSELRDPKDMYPLYLDVMQAQTALSKGDDRAAERLLRTVLGKEPELAPAQLLLGRILTARGRPGEAVELLQRAVAALPGDPVAWYALAGAANLAGDSDLALEACRQGLERFPEDAGLYDLLGVAYRIAGATAEAIAAGRRAVELDPNRAESLANLGASLTAAGRVDEALEVLQLYEELNSEGRHSVSRDVTQARTAFLQGDEATAERILRTVLRENPNLASAHLLLGGVLTARGSPGEAIQHLEKAVAGLPGDPSAWYALAAAANSAGESPLALETCQKGLERFPDDAALYEQLGVAHRIAGASAEAIGAGRRAVDLAPDRPSALNNLGASLAAAGELNEAVATLQRALELEPDFPDALRNLASVLFRAGNCPEAERYLRSLVRLAPGDGEARVNLVQALLCQQKSPDAVELAREILKDRPGEWLPTYLLCYGHIQLGEFGAAERTLRDYVEEHPGFQPAYEALCQVLLQQSPPKTADARALAGEARQAGVELPDGLLDRLNP